MATLYAGFDGGGTRTTCVLCDESGRFLGSGSGARSNFHDVGLPSAVSSLRSAFDGALAQSGMQAPDVEACFGLAGLDSPKDMSLMTDAIRSMGLTKSDPLVVNDWRTAVTGAFVDEPGVTLIAGTGCVAAAQTSAGRRMVRVGGWGHIVDDRGSAYDIGRDALYAAMRDYDGRGPKTKLLRMIMARMRVDEPQGIIARVYAEQMSVSEVASLSSVAGEAARAGDPVARAILREKGEILAELVVVAASKLKMTRSKLGVSLNGGVFNAGEPILGPLVKAIHASVPKAHVVEPKLRPAFGAVVLLLRRTGVDVDAPLVKRMRETAPGAQ